jgi:hypothetical protein
MDDALRTAIEGTRRTAARPETPAWLVSIRRAKAAAWEALPPRDKAEAAEALKRSKATRWSRAICFP